MFKDPMTLFQIAKEVMKQWYNKPHVLYTKTRGADHSKKFSYTPKKNPKKNFEKGGKLCAPKCGVVYPSSKPTYLYVYIAGTRYTCWRLEEATINRQNFFDAGIKDHVDSIQMMSIRFQIFAWRRDGSSVIDAWFCDRLRCWWRVTSISGF